MASESYGLSSTYLLDLLRVVERYGVAEEDLLRGIIDDRASLDDPNARTSLRTLEALVERAIELTGDPALGLAMGLQMQISSHGYLGFAALTASTIREALELAVRFAPIRFPALAIHLEARGDEGIITLEERADLGSAREFAMITIAVGFTRMGQALLGHPVEGRAEVAFPAPPFFEKIEGMIPGVVSFDADAHRLIFPREYLDRRIETANAAAMKLATEQCERELEEASRIRTFRDRVRGLLFVEGGVLSLEAIAKKLATSPRTLKRRLADEGTTYTELLDELRSKRAMELIANPELTLDEIASRLGYSDVANFSRAFRRWTGSAPGSYRRAQE